MSRRRLIQLLCRGLEHASALTCTSTAPAATSRVAASAAVVSTTTPPAWRQVSSSSSSHRDNKHQQQHHQHHHYQQQRRHATKCNTAAAAAGTPVSQAVACMVDRDVMPRQQLLSKMEQLSQQLAQQVEAFSSTELSAFAEACRKMEFSHPQAFRAIIAQLAPAAAKIPADELPSLLWAASTLAADAPAAKQQQQRQQAQPQSTSSSTSSTSSSISTTSSSRTVDVPQNDGVVGSVNSSRIAGLPEVVQFILGASQVLAGDLDALDSQELPVVAAALADLEYRDPFLLTVVADCALERKGELSESELVALIQSFAGMGRWFFDNRLIDQLTVVLVEAARKGQAAQRSVDAVAACLDGINHRNKVLAQYLDEKRSGGQQ